MADYISQFTGGEIDARLRKVSELEAEKQDALVSGENIKTVGGQSVLGSGDIPVGDENAVKFTPQTLTDAQKAQARANIDAVSLADIENMDFVTATSLPTASASTMGHIYLIGPDANDNYDRYFTQESGGSYSWVPLGSTQIDLSTYATKAEVDELEAKVDKVVIPLTLDGSIATGTTVGATIVLTPYSYTGWDYALVPCSEGDKLIINGTGGNNARLWCFVDANGKVLSLSGGGETGANLEIIAPSNSAFCIINTSHANAGTCYYISKDSIIPRLDNVEDDVSSLESDVSELEAKVDGTTNYESGYSLFNTNGAIRTDGSGQAGITWKRSGFISIQDFFSCRVWQHPSIASVAFYSAPSLSSFLGYAGGGTYGTEATFIKSGLTIPDGTQYVIISTENHSEDGRPYTDSDITTEQKVEGLEDAINGTTKTQKHIEYYADTNTSPTLSNLSQFIVGKTYKISVTPDSAISSLRIQTRDSSNQTVQTIASDISVSAGETVEYYWKHLSNEVKLFADNAGNNLPCIFEISYEEIKTFGSIDSRVSSLEIAEDWSNGYAHISFDDVYFCLYDITLHESDYDSLFDNSFFSTLKNLHDTYGAKFSLFVFLEDSTTGQYATGWNIQNTTNKFKTEFAENADWLKFGFHAKNKNTNYSASSAATALTDYNAFVSAVMSFADIRNIDRCPRLGNFAGNTESVIAMRDADGGIIGLLAAYDTRDSYYLSSSDSQFVYKHGDMLDAVNHIRFFTSLKALETLSPQSVFMDKYAIATADRFCNLNWMMHEYAINGQDYGYSSYDRDTMVERLTDACRISNNNGYTWRFPMDVTHH